MAIKAIAFDLFGTVFDLSGVERSEIGAYAAHVNAEQWAPLELPAAWRDLPAFPDVGALRELRRKYTLATLSNCPLRLQIELSRNNAIDWDVLIPLELKQVYKPHLDAYRFVPDLLGCKPDEVLMVTANKDFGDLEAAAELGMASVLIRGEEFPGLHDLRLHLIRKEASS